MEEFDELRSGDGFVTMINIPTLQTIASYSVAQSLMCRFISFYTQQSFESIAVSNISESLKFFCSDVANELIESLTVVPSVQVILKTSLEKVHSQMKIWINDFQHNSCFIYLSRHRINYFKVSCWVWLQSGEIDYAKTASKMLSDLALNARQKFSIMCWCCLEEEIEKISFDRVSRYVWKPIYPDDNFVLHYWICYVKNKLDEVPLYNFDSSVYEQNFSGVPWNSTFGSVYASLAWKSRNEKPVIFKYFWSRGSIYDQLLVAREIFKNEKSCRIDVFQMMSSFQRRWLLADIPETIIKNLCLNIGESSLAILWAWEQSKHSFTIDQFICMAEYIHDTATNREEVIRVLIEFCIAAPDHFRNYMLQKLEEMLKSYDDQRKDYLYLKVLKMMINFPSIVPSMLHLLSIVLSFGSDDARKQFASSNKALKLAAVIEDPFDLQEVLNVCLPNPDDQAKFKKQVDFLPSITSVPFTEAGFDMLKNKLHFFIPDIKARMEFQMKLIESIPTTHPKLLFQLRIHEWEPLSAFIDEIYLYTFIDELYLYTPTSAYKTKKKLFSSLTFQPLYLKTFNGIEKFIQLVEFIFTDTDTKELKIIYLESLKKTWCNRKCWDKFDGFCFEEYSTSVFITWCLDNDAQLVRSFKEDYQLMDAVFDEVFRFLNECLIQSGVIQDCCSLIYLDEFLTWGIQNQEERRLYKLARLYKFNDFEIFEKMSNLGNRALKSRQQLLNWFCENNREVIETFKEGNPSFGATGSYSDFVL